MFSLFRIFSRLLDNDNPEPVDISERQRQHANRKHWSEQNIPNRGQKYESRSANMGKTMSDEVLTRFIIGRFAQHVPYNDVIRAVAIEADISWSQAQAAVRRVYRTHRREIARKQAPLFIAIGLITFTAGTGLTAGAVFATIKGVIIILFALPFPYSGNLLLFVVGLAMMIGSLYGMLRRRG
jgi:Mg/Co/Ni transporter MgtE